MPSHEAPPPNDRREPTNVLISIVVATFIISVVGTFIATVTFIRQGNMKTRIAQLETQASLRKTTDHLDDLKGFGLKLDDVLKDIDTEPSPQDPLTREQCKRNLKAIGEALKEYATSNRQKYPSLYSKPDTPLNEGLWKHLKENPDGTLFKAPDDKPKDSPE